MFKLSISNIGWNAEDDYQVYEIMLKNDFSGLEIAPTRIFPNDPYMHLKEAKEWSRGLSQKFNFSISSMQSIWYGRNENMFSSNQDRQNLLTYTMEAIDFASSINCKNLVFGCPKNRNIHRETDKFDSIPFFKEIGDYALSKGTCIGLEANPPIYNTNFINTTSQAIDLINEVNSSGFKLNLDVGTMIQNGENPYMISSIAEYINHVHISEPMLSEISSLDFHRSVLSELSKAEYNHFVSIEMGNKNDIHKIQNAIESIRCLTNDI